MAGSQTRDCKSGILTISSTEIACHEFNLDGYTCVTVSKVRLCFRCTLSMRPSNYCINAIIQVKKTGKKTKLTYIMFLLLVTHEEVDDDRDGIVLMQELTLNVTHSSKVEQQTKVLCQVLALWPSVLLQLYIIIIIIIIIIIMTYMFIR